MYSDLLVWWHGAIIILGCSMVQSIAGFGFSLLSIPLLLFSGYSLPHSVVISLTTSAAQRLFVVRSMRRHVPWRYLLPVIVAALVMVPAGVGVQWMVDQRVPMQLIRQGVGGMILLTLTLRYLWRSQPGERVAPGWGLVAGGTAGFLTGLANIGGPPLVLWSHSHRWPVERLRVVVIAVSLPLVPFQVVLQVLVYGHSIVSALLLALGLVPVSLLGAWVGMHVGSYFSLKWLKVVVYLLLLAIAGMAIVRPLFS